MSRSRVAIFTRKQTAPLHLTGLVMVFGRLSEASDEICSKMSEECSEISLISPKVAQFVVRRNLQLLTRTEQ